MPKTLSRRALVVSAGVGIPASALIAACKTSDAPRASAPNVRGVERVIDAQPTIEGAGVHLRRSLGSRALPLLDPFLMLDEFHSDRPEDYVAGFPSHPHRGFETVTYMIEGAMEHRDSLGNHGRLGPGSTQWMTAGHGIIHSEMPKQANGQNPDLLWGFQLWVNLPAVNKMTKPRYQDLAPDRIEKLAIDDAAVGLIAGEAKGKRGPVDGIVTAPQMLDVKIPAHGKFAHAIPSTHNAFVYVFEGATLVGPQRTRVVAGQLAVLGNGDLVSVTDDGGIGGRFLLLAGRPIGEPVARAGPFVMNTDAELRRAFDDYRSGKLVDG